MDMPPPQIEFFAEEIDLPPIDEERVIAWINEVIAEEGGSLNGLNFIFCSDQYLHQINLEYLQHDTFTDIITFPLSDFPSVEGDIFISWDRIQENAVNLGEPIQRELHRVLIHGVLHLCGFADKTQEEATLMRSKEDEKLSRLDL
jgi:probable rRNA maturation factor